VDESEVSARHPSINQPFFISNSAELCHQAHSVFLAARVALCASAANPHEIKRFVNGRLRAIEKSAA
jgi:hypothetical protein